MKKKVCYYAEALNGWGADVYWNHVEECPICKQIEMRTKEERELQRELDYLRRIQVDPKIKSSLLARLIRWARIQVLNFHIKHLLK